MQQSSAATALTLRSETESSVSLASPAVLLAERSAPVSFAGALAAPPRNDAADDVVDDEDARRGHDRSTRALCAGTPPVAMSDGVAAGDDDGAHEREVVVVLTPAGAGVQAHLHAHDVEAHAPAPSSSPPPPPHKRVPRCCGHAAAVARKRRCCVTQCAWCARHRALCCCPRTLCYALPHYEPRWLAAFLLKWEGEHQKRPARDPVVRAVVGAVGGLLGIGLLAVLHTYGAIPTGADVIMMSFGATSVMLFAVPTSPLSQPRNVIGGHVIAAVAGLALRCALELPPGMASVPVQWLALPLAIAVTIAAQMLTATVHPPGGATALIAASISVSTQPAYGWWFVLAPVLAGALLLLAVALVVNNVRHSSRYPRFWW